MRVLARIGCTLAGLALAAPAAKAGMPIPAPGPYNAGIPKARKAAAKTTVKTPERLCGECQRQRLMAQTGMSIAPPPPLPPGEALPCTKCGAPAVVISPLSNPAPAMSSAPLTVVQGAEGAPGRAVVGGPEGMTGSDPAPIGVVQPRLAAAMPMPSGRRDPSVMPTSGSNPIGPPRNTNMPNVLTHLFGLSEIGRGWSEARDRRREAKHASIPYGPQTSSVHELPASVVYGGR